MSVPGAEIWRHGVDLESVRQLVPGDDIYLKCVGPEAGAARIFAAAVHLGDQAGIRYVVGYPGRVLTAESVGRDLGHNSMRANLSRKVTLG
ncbi:MAG TPA: hypothetical protein VMB25_08310 [Bryobacteraceae bacterium]|nr:hypothetical protein [Bryobacteraceae bacterium]